MRKILILLLLFPLLINAQIFYVAHPDSTYAGMGAASDNNDGSFAHPWATWQKGWQTVDKGDTLYMRGGRYKPTELQPGTSSGLDINPLNGKGHSGSTDTFIYISSYPGERAIYDCINLRGPYLYLTGIGMGRWHYVHFNGFSVENVVMHRDNLTVQGFSAGSCFNLKFENISVNYIGGKGFNVIQYWQLVDDNDSVWFPESMTMDYDSTIFLNCDASYCIDSFSRNGDVDDEGGWADGFWSNIQNQESVLTYTNCRVWMCSDDGFDTPTKAEVTWDGCWSWRNGLMTNGVGQGLRVGQEDSTATIYNTVKNCILVYNKYSNLAEEGNSYPWFNLNVHNNLMTGSVYGIAIAGLRYGEKKNNNYKNNITFNHEGFDVLGYHWMYAHSNNTWKQDKVWWYQEGSALPDGPNVTVTVDDFQSLDTTQLSRPRKADGSLPDITFGRLAPDSDLIGAGTDVGMSETPDIGIDWAWLDAQDASTIPILSTTLATSIWTRAALSGGIVASDEGDAVTARGVCWNTSANPTTSNSKTVNGTGEGSFSSQITGLSPSTTYYVRAYATNGNGTAYGSQVSFTTPAFSRLNATKTIMYNGKKVIIR